MYTSRQSDTIGALYGNSGDKTETSMSWQSFRSIGAYWHTIGY